MEWQHQFSSLFEWSFMICLDTMYVLNVSLYKTFYSFMMMNAL